MIDEQTNKRLCNGFIWLVAGMALLILLTSCSPLDDFTPKSTPTTTPGPTATPPLLSSDVEIVPSATPEVCTVSTGYQAGTLNIRKGPGTNHAVIRVLAEGESLQVINQGEWLKVITRENLTGFVNSKFCK